MSFHDRLGLSILAAFALAISASACPDKAPNAPVDAGPRDGRGTELGAICAKLHALGCPEGEDVSPNETCYEHLVKRTALAPVPDPPCLLDAGTREALRACGDPRTSSQFRCKHP